MWTHPKHKGLVFKGSFDRNKFEGRFFFLIAIGTPKGHKIPQEHQFAFESWQQAKRLGWVKK